MKYPKKHPWAHPWKAKKQRRRPAIKAKPARRVFVTLEIETDVKLEHLKNREWWLGVFGFRVIQAQANVAQATREES